MTARLSTERETLDAVTEGARTEDCGTIARGEFNTHRNIKHLDQALRDVDAEDLEVYAHAMDLESVAEFRAARVELAYEQAQEEGMGRWRQ